MSVRRRPVFDLTFVLKPPWCDLPHTNGSHWGLAPLTKYLGLWVGHFFCVIQAFPDEIAFCQ